MHEIAFKITLKAIVRSLNQAHTDLERTRTAQRNEREKLVELAATSIFYAAARIENILAHLEQDIDITHATEEEEQDYEALFRSAGV